MSPRNSELRDALHAELAFHQAEFNALRSEIVQWLEAERQYLNLCLVAIAAGLGAFPFIVQQKAFVVLLLYPFIFHVLLTEMLNVIRAFYGLGSYLLEELIPRVNTILDRIGDEREGTIILGWEFRAATRGYLGKSMRLQDWVLSSLTPTRLWVPILAIAGLIIAYPATITNFGYQPSLVELVLIALNIVFLLLAATRNLTIVRASTERARIVAKQIEKL
jgi:hypothetical protein